MYDTYSANYDMCGYTTLPTTCKLHIIQPNKDTSLKSKF